MITILILENVGYLYDIQDFNIVETFGSGEHSLNFTISKQHPYYKSIFEEMKVIYKGYNSYVIKSIDEQQETAIISCRLYLDELQAIPIIEYKSENQNLGELLSEFLHRLGWSHEDASLIGIRRTNELDYGNLLDLLRLAQNTYKAVFEYDTINRIIKVMPIENYENKGVYFTDELNLKEVYLRGDSFEYCTRLIPIGAEGLTIKKVNNDILYVENFQYSPKIITRVWKDERFTDPQSLKDEAIEKLKILSKPVRTYDLAVIDMAEIDKDYSSLKFNIGDKVTLIDRVRQVKVEHQIVKLTRYPDEPRRNTAELNMSAKGFTNVVKNLIDGNAIITDIQGKRIAELKFDMNTFSVKFEEYTTDAKSTITQIIAEAGRIDAVVKDQKQIIDANTGDIIKVNENVSAISVEVGNITSTVSENKTSTDKAINAKSSTYTERPNIYSIGDTWIVENDTIAPPYKAGDMLTAVKNNTIYNPNDWDYIIRYGKDIDNFIEITYKNDIATLKNQIDEKADIWYREEDPSKEWGELDKTEHIGDMWCKISTKETFIYSYYSDSGTFAWEPQAIPQEVFDKIDGKSSLYVTRPTSYNKNDMWIVENDNVIPPYKTGDWLTAIKSNTAYNPDDWDDKVRYGKDINNTIKRIEKAETVIDQNTTDITLRATREEVTIITDNLGDIDKRVEKAESSITVNTDAIKSRVTKEEITELTGQINDNFSIVDKRVTKAESSITQNATDITLKATKEDITTATSGLTTKTELEAAINLQNNAISAKVSKDDLSGKTSTELTIKPDFVQIAWNKVSEFIQFINAQLQIKDNSNQLLMSLSKDGMNLYNENLLVGQFTTNYFGTSWSPTIRGTAQTCNLDCYISWELVTSGGNELIMAYFDKDVDVYNKNMRTGLNIGKTTYFHQNPLVLDRAGEVEVSANNGNMSIRHSVSGSHSITFGGNAGAVFTNYGLNMMGNSITNVNILSYNSIQTKGRSVSKKGFLASYSSEKLHTHVDQVEVIAGDNIIELPEFFKGQGLNYHVFLSKQGKGDIWYSNKTNQSFVIHSENNMMVSYEIKFIINEKVLEKI